MGTDRVLVIEDDADIRALIEHTLDRAGFDVTAAADAEEALGAQEGVPPDLAIVDWMLPGMSGIDLARRLRRDPALSDLPLLMLTARGQERDKLTSFDAGIDDYVTKPFSPRELTARVRAILRRSGRSDDGRLIAATLELDTRSHRVTVNGSDVRLGPTEFRLLEFLLRHPDRALTREQLLDRVWGRNVYVDERTVDVHVLRLRKALAPHGLDRLVQTVRGVGYRLSPAADG